jgi:hypothetical protein
MTESDCQLLFRRSDGQEEGKGYGHWDHSPFF